MIVIFGELKSLKNSKQIYKIKRRGQKDKTIITASDAYKDSEAHFIGQCMINKVAFRKMLEGKEKPYRISFKIYRQTKGRFDFVNIVQGLMDCMVKAQLLDDDNANEVIPVFEPYAVDSNSPRTEIKVL